MTSPTPQQALRAFLIAIGLAFIGCSGDDPEISDTPIATTADVCPPTDFRVSCAPLQGVTCPGVVLCAGFATESLDDGPDPDNDMAFMWDGSTAALCDGAACVDVGNSYCAEREPLGLMTPAPTHDDDAGGAL